MLHHNLVWALYKFVLKLDYNNDFYHWAIISIIVVWIIWIIFFTFKLFVFLIFFIIIIIIAIFIIIITIVSLINGFIFFVCDFDFHLLLFHHQANEAVKYLKNSLRLKGDIDHHHAHTHDEKLNKNSFSNHEIWVKSYFDVITSFIIINSFKH